MPHYKKLLFLIVCLGVCLTACSPQQMLGLQPGGPISRAEDELLAITFWMMLSVLVPVFVMTAWFSWQYRASNKKANYAPKWDASPKIETAIWLLPALVVLLLATITWIYTHRLDPFKPLNTDIKPLEVQVIALDWKWLFIYPEQKVAAVNELVIPGNRPISFKITSDTVMNSFFIPRLGGQIFAMAGMQTELQLMADKPGHYFGENTQFSGHGFPYQNFKAIVGTEQQFENWVHKARQSSQQLTLQQFQSLALPSSRNPVTYYSSVESGLFKEVIHKYNSSPKSTPHTTNNHSGAAKHVR